MSVTFTANPKFKFEVDFALPVLSRQKTLFICQSLPIFVRKEAKQGYSNHDTFKKIDKKKKQRQTKKILTHVTRKQLNVITDDFTIFFLVLTNYIDQCSLGN